MKLALQLTNFYSTDNLKLPALHYKSNSNTKKVALFLHGNGSSSVFYKADFMNTLAQELCKNDIAFFPFNNRGAHIVKILKQQTSEGEERVAYGMAYELINECVADIDGALLHLQTLGYETFYLIGHSTGANKIAVYNKYKPNSKIAKYVLLAGGDDTGLYYDELGKEKYYKTLEECRAILAEGKGRKIIPKRIMQLYISYQSLYDTINPDGDYNVFSFYEARHSNPFSNRKLFDTYRRIRKPTHVIYGAADEYCYGRVEDCVNILKNQSRDLSNFTYTTVSGADHGFTGYEAELAKIIANWL